VEALCFEHYLRLSREDPIDVGGADGGLSANRESPTEQERCGARLPAGPWFT
jgi:hypothetical protein